MPSNVAKPALRTRCLVTAGLAATTMLLAAAPAAQALTTVQAGVSVGGVSAGGVIQLPITTTSPIQVCSNNVAAGLIAVQVNAFTGSGCAQIP